MQQLERDSSAAAADHRLAEVVVARAAEVEAVAAEHFVRAADSAVTVSVVRVFELVSAGRLVPGYLLETLAAVSVGLVVAQAVAAVAVELELELEVAVGLDLAVRPVEAAPLGSVQRHSSGPAAGPAVVVAAVLPVVAAVAPAAVPAVPAAAEHSPYSGHSWP